MTSRREGTARPASESHRWPTSLVGALAGLLVALMILYPPLALVALLMATGWLVGRAWEQLHIEREEERDRA